jgi:acyl carrier protein
MKTANDEACLAIEAQLRSYIDTNLVYSDELPYKDDSSFLEEGLIDSMGVMELVSYVQSQFGMTVEPSEITPDNFDSIDRLASFIRRKLCLSPIPEDDDAGTKRAAGK